MPSHCIHSSNSEVGLVFLRIVDVTYTDESGTSLLVFLVDHVSGIIEKKQVVELEDVASHDIYGIHARGNTILCFYDCGSRWVMTVSELGQDPALKHFTFNIKVRRLVRPLPGIEAHVRFRVRSLWKSSPSWCLRMRWSYVVQRESTFTTSLNSALRKISQRSALSGSGQENLDGSVEVSQ